LPARVLWTNGCATVTVGKPCSAAHDQNRNSALISLTSGYCFNAGEWNFPDSLLRGIYAKREVYRNITGWHSFEPWLSRIETFSRLELGAIAEDVPPEWIDPDLVNDLADRIDNRRSRVRELIAEVRKSTHNPFSAWTEEKP
jgi:hypothetical protein